MKRCALRLAIRPLITVCLLLLFGIANAAGFRVTNGKIYDDTTGQEIQLRGINHHGFNGKILQPEYLWTMGWREQIAQIKQLGFNAVRLPITPHTLYEDDQLYTLSSLFGCNLINSNLQCDESASNRLIAFKTSLAALDLWMREAERQGIYVLLDMHSITDKTFRSYRTWFLDPADQAICDSPDAEIRANCLSFDGQHYDADDWRRDLAMIASRYAGFPHFIGIDVYNEPHDVVRWNTGDLNWNYPAYFWKPAVESAAAAILAANPNLLIFVQGTQENSDGREIDFGGVNWGENFQPQGYTADWTDPQNSAHVVPRGVLNIPGDKLVLSPHTYGPDVFYNCHRFGRDDTMVNNDVPCDGINPTNFPANLPTAWNVLFGQFYPAHAVVLGEFGGHYGLGGNPSGHGPHFKSGQEMDRQWQDALVTYLVDKGIRSGFYWTYVNSGDSGSLLDMTAADPFTYHVPKHNLLKRLWGVTSGASTIAFTAPSYTIAQTAGTVTLNVTRTGGTSGSVVVDYSTWNNLPLAEDLSPSTQDALAGTHYTVRHGTLTWGDQDGGTKSITVPINAANGFSGQKSFNVAFTILSGDAMPAAASVAEVRINGSGTPPTGDPQPTITSFTPQSGIVGTVVTIAGTGLSGITSAWVGNGHDAAVQLISSTQIKVTVPQDATTGRIGIFNASKQAFTANDFLVTTQTPQPIISSFSPTFGPIGTVVTINGTGFTGMDHAWVGSAHDAQLQFISDSQVKVTIPSDAATGAIGIFSANDVAFTASQFEVTAQGAQPIISHFTPTSGPPGTVVTIIGTGFLGMDHAWVGSAYDALLDFASDTQVRVTIPLDATTGAIGIFNTANDVAFTATSFTVTQDADQHPIISNFSPTSGPPGTIVTINGTGFTGMDHAWVGNAHDGLLQPISATQVRVTIPQDATTGAIGIFNSTGEVAFTATSFVVQ